MLCDGALRLLHIFARYTTLLARVLRSCDVDKDSTAEQEAPWMLGPHLFKRVVRTHA